MTTLELAEHVARAVLQEQDLECYYIKPDMQHAVLRCLHQHQSWFCRLTLTEDNQRLHADTLEEPYELVQLEMFK